MTEIQCSFSVTPEVDLVCQRRAMWQVAYRDVVADYESTLYRCDKHLAPTITWITGEVGKQLVTVLRAAQGEMAYFSKSAIDAMRSVSIGSPEWEKPA